MGRRRSGCSNGCNVPIMTISFMLIWSNQGRWRISEYPEKTRRLSANELNYDSENSLCTLFTKVTLRPMLITGSGRCSGPRM